ASVPTSGWIGLVYMIFAAGVVGFTAYYLAVAKVGAAKTSMVSYVIPIVAAFAAWPLLGEQPQPAHIIGLALVLSGVLVVNLNRKPVTVAVPEGQ
ncbi:MAG: DMT family transporter, partial [Armatimonadota bacterium]